MQIDSLKYVRNRFNLPFTDEQLEEVPFYRPSENSPELKYMKALQQAW
jgi:pyruvate dehydrogenase E1 component